MGRSFHSFLTLLVGVAMLILATLFVFAKPPVVDSAPITNPVYSYSKIVAPALLDSVAAYIVLDEETGDVLLEKEADTPRPIASVVKLFGAAALLGGADLEATTTIETSDVLAPEDFGKLAVGDSYTVRDLLFPYLLESSNDAGVVIGRVASAAIKTEIATLLATTGLTGAVVIDDINGLSDSTIATPRAVAMMVRHLARTEPTLFDITTLPRYLGQAPLVNNSPFVGMPAYRGGKHGYTPAAGKTFVVRVVVPFADGERTLIIAALDVADYETTYLDLLTLTRESVSRVSAATSSSGILPSSSE